MTLATLSRWYPRLFLAAVILFSAVAPRPGPVSAAPTAQSSGMTVLRSTYVGGSENDVIHDMAVDAFGNVYLTGETQSPDFPRVKPLYNHFPHQDDQDLFVTKLDRDGNVVFSSVFGGEYFDAGFGVAAGPDGSVYVVGDTESLDFPAGGRLISRQEYVTGIFVMHINADGSEVLYSTMIGNTGDPYDQMDIAVDAAGNAFVTGSMSDKLYDDGSHDFPIANPVQDCTIPTDMNGKSGWSFGFVTEISPTASHVIFSTCIHDANRQDGQGIHPNSIALDSEGDIYIAGNTTSTDLPLVNPIAGTGSCDRGVNYCGDDTFAMKINPDSGDILYSTYLASGGDDKMHGIAVGPDDSLYLTGLASSGRGFPETRANQGTCTGDSCMYAAFVARIAKDGGAFHFSTLFGEIDDSAASRGDIAVDLAGDAYIVGTMKSDTFPIINPIHPMTRISKTAFVAHFDPQGEVHMSSQWSGNSDEQGLAAGVDIYGNVYIAGRTSSDDLPRVGIPVSQPATCAWSSNCLEDGFLAKFGTGAPLPTASFSAPAYTTMETDGNVTLTVRLDAPAEREITVGYDTLVDTIYNTYDDTALAPNDYASAHGAVTFAPGQTEASFSIPIHDNPTEEAPEHFKVGLKTGANAWIDRTPAQVTIMDGCETDGWERVAWPTPFNGAYHRPVALDFAAPDDGWMVGNYWDEANSTARPLVHHYDGTGWQVVSLGDIRAQLTSVLAFGPNDVWTAGMDGSAIHAVVLHYDGISWTAFSPVPPAERAYSIDSFAGTGDNDLWVLGFLRDIGWDPDSYRILLHWDGASWKTFYLGSSGFEYYAVRSTGPGQAALIGTYYNRYSSDYINAMITTYDANGQTGGNMDNAYGYDRYLVTADLAPNGELFAVGRQYDDYLFTTEEPLIVRSFAGGNLNAVTTPYTYFYNNWVYDQSPMHNDTTYLNSVRAFTENDVWAVGETRAYSTGETTPVMLHYDGNVWDRVNAPAAFASMDRGGGVMWALDRSGGLYRLSALRQCAATIVTAAGGTITSGRATVTVPPNAVNDTIFMTLQPVLEPSQPLPDGQTLVTGAVVAVNDALGNPLGQIATNLGLSFNLFGLGSSVSALAEEPPVISILRREGAEWKMTCTNCPVSAEGVVSVQTDRTGEFVVVKGPAGEPPAGTATVSLSNLAQVYDGEPRPVSASTNPPGLSVAITYNGSSIPPTEAGTYTVSAVVTEANYEGSTSGELLIAKAPTTTLLQAPRVAGLGRSVTLTALVSPTGNLTGIIHGTVTFFDGAQVLGMVELSNTTNGFEAVLTVSDLALGAHNLTARYEESDNIAGSTSATGMLAVLPNALYLPVVSK